MVCPLGMPVAGRSIGESRAPPNRLSHELHLARGLTSWRTLWPRPLGELLLSSERANAAPGGAAFVLGSPLFLVLLMLPGLGVSLRAARLRHPILGCPAG
jgi:hypothetical protein